MTYYAPGLGSCGITSNPPADHINVVALSREIMANPPNPNSNPKCGSKITIYNPATKKKHTATIVDTCWACKKEDIDVNVELFRAVAPRGDGRVHGIMWSGPKVGGGKLPQGNSMVVQQGGLEWGVDGDEEGEVKGEDFDDGMWGLDGEEGRGESGAELELELAEEEIVREKEGCMGKVSRIMRHLRVWA
ncbi:MAG: hypothetical protein Q9182_006052 [Xanthomendoza sp. 2 TL-2023]